jgi:hypothetical protein
VIAVEWEGKTYTVPACGPDENSEIFEVIPSDDHAMAFLMQHGNLRVPCGEYGSDTITCAHVAMKVSKIMEHHHGEPTTYYMLNSDMGLVVNSADGVGELLDEYGYMLEEVSS